MSAVLAANPDVFRRELVHVSRSLHGFVHEGIMPICQGHDVTPQQMYVLTELLNEPGQSAGQLSDRAAFCPPISPPCAIGWRKGV